MMSSHFVATQAVKILMSNMRLADMARRTASPSRGR
jgi:hypothetical protein